MDIQIDLAPTETRSIFVCSNKNLIAEQERIIIIEVNAKGNYFVEKICRSLSLCLYSFLKSVNG